MISKLSINKKIAILLVVIHIVFVFFVFHRENKIFSDLDASCTMYDDEQVGMPFPMLMVSDFYLIFIINPLQDYIPFEYYGTEDEPGFFRYSGTGGPCTFFTINSELPYSLVFIFISSVIYYLVGLIFGSLVERIFIKLNERQ